MNRWHGILYGALLASATPQLLRAQSAPLRSSRGADSLRSTLPVMVTRANVLRLPTREVLPRVQVPARSTAARATPASRLEAAGGALNRRLSETRAALSGISLAPAAVPALAAGLALASLFCALLYARRRAARRRTAGGEGSAAAARAGARPGADPRLWAARTLAVDGLDAFDVARRTGLPRDVARLIVRGTRRNVPAAAATAGSALAAQTPRAGRSGGATYWFTDN
jgi:hypothetical protein